MQIGEVHIIKMFSSYSSVLKDSHQESLHHCSNCGQDFKIPVRFRMCESTSIVCPECATRIRFGDSNADNLYVRNDGVGPITMRIRLYEFKDSVKLIVNGIRIAPTGYDSSTGRFWSKSTYKEEFRFDTKKRKTTWSMENKDKKINLTLEPGHPKTLYKLSTTSVLRFLFAHQSIIKQKSEVIELLRILRETVHKKLERNVGHKVSSLFCASGKSLGWLLFPIINIAYRMLLVDAPNLRPLGTAVELTQRYKFPENMDWDILRKTKGTVAGLIRAAALPDTRSVRRVLTNDPFALQRLIFCHQLFKRSDLTMKAFPHFSDSEDMGYTRVHAHPGLLNIRDYYTENDLLRLITRSRSWVVNDAARLITDASNAILAELRAHPPRIQDLHDWLALMQRRENQPDFAIDVETEPIRRRLGMQLDRIRFFLPDQAKTLYDAGEALHNCVGSYASRMRNGETNIVLIANTQGRLIACIEVTRGEIRQAKLDRNRPVSKNVEINAKIIEWAKTTGIKYQDCSDIRNSDAATETAAAIA